MSEIIKYYCDSCGKECGRFDDILKLKLTRSGCSVPTEASVVVSHDGPDMEPSDHLCTGCAQRVMEGFYDHHRKGGFDAAAKEEEAGMIRCMCERCRNDGYYLAECDRCHNVVRVPYEEDPLTKFGPYELCPGCLCKSRIDKVDIIKESLPEDFSVTSVEWGDGGEFTLTGEYTG